MASESKCLLSLLPFHPPPPRHNNPTHTATATSQVDNVSNPQQATPVTKAGKPIASCWSVCEDFCPEFFEAVGGLPGVCKFSLGCGEGELGTGSTVRVYVCAVCSS